MGLGAAARLARWLGPWADQVDHPPVSREEVLGASGLRARVYRPVARAARGSLLLVPGLHPEGPGDPRLDRFAAVLAGAGMVVYAPFMRDFMALRLKARLLDDARGALDGLLALPDRPAGRPGVFSVSFGSLPALSLAAERGAELGGVVTFGGYADWRRALAFCLTGAPGVPHDPLNRPVVYLNLLPWLPGAPRDTASLVSAWMRFVEATWGRVEMKAPGASGPVARELAVSVQEDARGLFLEGCGAGEAGLTPAVRAALAAAGDRSWLDPRPLLARAGCRVTVVHGADDDVIPHTEADALYAALRPDRRAGHYVTGLYGHTGASGGRGPVALAREFVDMMGIVRAIARVAGA
mgnify:CR=1 FL=1